MMRKSSVFVCTEFKSLLFIAVEEFVRCYNGDRAKINYCRSAGALLLFRRADRELENFLSRKKISREGDLLDALSSARPEKCSASRFISFTLVSIKMYSTGSDFPGWLAHFLLRVDLIPTLSTQPTVLYIFERKKGRK
jgi:hypothetical protein